MGFSFKRMFKHPFGGHSLFHKATQIASILPIPGAGLIGKAFGLANRAKRLGARLGPILTAASAAGFVPQHAHAGVMPGGLRAGAAGRAHGAQRRAARPRARARKRGRRRGVRR